MSLIYEVGEREREREKEKEKGVQKCIKFECQSVYQCDKKDTNVESDQRTRNNKQANKKTITTNKEQTTTYRTGNESYFLRQSLLVFSFSFEYYYFLDTMLNYCILRLIFDIMKIYDCFFLRFGEAFFQEKIFLFAFAFVVPHRRICTCIACVT